MMATPHSPPGDKEEEKDCSRRKGVSFDASVLAHENEREKEQKRRERDSFAVLSRSQLLAEEPCIDAALKSFASWWIAQASSSAALAAAVATGSPCKNCNPQFHSSRTIVPLITARSAAANSSSSATTTGLLTTKSTMKYTRLLSKSINAHVCAVQDTVVVINRGKGEEKRSDKNDCDDEIDDDDDSNRTKEQQQEQQLEQSMLVAQAWNEVVMQKQKPTKVLGRTSLRSVWKHIELDPELSLLSQRQQETARKEEEERCATTATDAVIVLDSSSGATDAQEMAAASAFLQTFEFLLFDTTNCHPDARLVWSKDGKGQAELARRAADRNKRAATTTTTASVIASVQPQPREGDQNNSDDNDHDRKMAAAPASSVCDTFLLKSFAEEEDDPL